MESVLVEHTLYQASEEGVHCIKPQSLPHRIPLIIASSKEKFIFWNKYISNIDVHLFLSLLYELQFDDWRHIFAQTASSGVFGAVYGYVKGTSGTY